MENNWKKQPETWEAVFGILIALLLGFWTGFVFRESGSWAIETLHRWDFKINGLVLISALAVLYLVIDVIKEAKRHRSKK